MKDAFIQAMSRAVSSVYVVTTDGPAGRFGITVSAVSSISADPEIPTLMACIHNESAAAQAIQKNQAFCINLLSRDQTEISNCFAGRTGKTGEEKFTEGTWDAGETGCPILENALAAFDCRLKHEMRVGSHHIFIGETAHIQSQETGLPLLYGDRKYQII